MKDAVQRRSALKRIICNNLSVRDSESLARKLNKQAKAEKSRRLSAAEQRLVNELRMKLGTKIDVVREAGCGRIEIEFYTDEDFDRIVEILL